jgi:hypothetical protein
MEDGFGMCTSADRVWYRVQCWDGLGIQVREFVRLVLLASTDEWPIFLLVPCHVNKECNSKRQIQFSTGKMF